MRRLLAIAATLIAISATPAQAYGVYGHGTIARIALANVRPQTRAAVLALVARARALDTPMCATRTIEDLSVWPDCIRGLGPRFSYTASWHYQNVEVCSPFDLKSACKDGNCVSAQIDRDVKLLKDRTLPLRERIAALSFLVHFTGDLHMPLHAGDHHDLGGNQVKASYGAFTTARLNLHGIWDGVLAERAITDGPDQVRRLPPDEAAAVQAGTTEDWSREAWEISRAVTYPSAVGDAYCTTAPPGQVTLDEATIARLVPIARRQVERAGLRLARLLDEAFA
ncbi:MAG: S1/P1 nuclease [Sphingomonas sp.]|nr:S1/P1 nuclease [Sphingomonas sp.]